MTPETKEAIVELERKFDEHRQEEKKWLAEAVHENVNGKIDKLDEKIESHNRRHENDMKRILPTILAYEASQRVLEDARVGGKFILWWSGFVIAVGSAYLIIRQVFRI